MTRRGLLQLFVAGVVAPKPARTLDSAYATPPAGTSVQLTRMATTYYNHVFVKLLQHKFRFTESYNGRYDT